MAVVIIISRDLELNVSEKHQLGEREHWSTKGQCFYCSLMYQLDQCKARQYLINCEQRYEVHFLARCFTYYLSWANQL